MLSSTLDLPAPFLPPITITSPVGVISTADSRLMFSAVSRTTLRGFSFISATSYFSSRANSVWYASAACAGTTPFPQARSRSTRESSGPEGRSSASASS